MLTIKGMQGLGSGLLPMNGISPLILTLFLSLIFPYSSAVLLPQVVLLLSWSWHLSISNFRSLLKLMSIKLVTPSNHLILCRSLLLLPSIFPIIRVFSNESVLHIRWPKYWSFSFSISPFNEYSGLLSFRTNWLDLLAVQGTLKSLLQHYISKASVLRHSAFWASPTTSWQTHAETMELVTDFILGGSKITADGDWSHEIKRCLLLEEKLWPT